MPLPGTVRAYLIAPFAPAAGGLWIKEGETVCFERELALEIAEADSRAAAWVGVYALDADGRCLFGSPIASYGDFNGDIKRSDTSDDAAGGPGPVDAAPAAATERYATRQ